MCVKVALTEVQKQVLANQEKILEQQHLITETDTFWEHLGDHLIMSFAFFCLGAVVFAWFIIRLIKSRIRLDHALDEGTIMRVIDEKKKKKWLIVNPMNTWQFYDIIILSFFDKGRDKFIEMQDTKRIRIIRRIIVVILIMLIWSGVSLVLSASKTNMDVLYYLRLYLEDLFGNSK